MVENLNFTEDEIAFNGWVTSPMKAIREKCVDCCGGNRHEIKVCPVKSCMLWPFRYGKNPFRKKRELTDEQRQAIADRLEKARRAKG